MKLIYVAGKYTGDTYSAIDDNIRISEVVSLKLIRKGWAVITPHKNTAHYEVYEDDTLTYHTWIAIDDEILKRCDAILMMKNWIESKGSKRELEIAKKLNIPIYFEADGIPEVNNE